MSSIFNSLNLKKSTEINKCVDSFKNEIKSIEGRIAKDLLISPRGGLRDNPMSVEIAKLTDRQKLIQEIAAVKTKRQPYKKKMDRIIDKEYKIRRLKGEISILKEHPPGLDINKITYLHSGIHSTLVSPVYSRDQSPVFSPEKTATLDFGSCSNNTKRVFVPKIDMTKINPSGNINYLNSNNMYPFSNVNSKYNSSSRLDSGNNSANVSIEMSKRTLLYDTTARKETKLANNLPVKVTNENIFRTDTRLNDHLYTKGDRTIYADKSPFKIDTKDRTIYADKSPIKIDTKDRLIIDKSPYKLKSPIDSRSNSKSRIAFPNVYANDRKRKESISNLIDKLPQIIERSESINKSILATTKSFKKK
jgi:hypothetical protein